MSSVAHRPRSAALAAAAAVAVLTGCTPAAPPDARPAAAPETTRAVQPVADPAEEEPRPELVVPAAATEEVEGAERGVARARTVAVDASVLPAAGEAAAPVELPLFDDTTVVAEIGAPQVRPDAGYRTWTGAVAGDPTSSVVLVEQDGALAGLVTGAAGTYRLRVDDEGRTRVEEIDPSEFPADSDDTVDPPAPAAEGELPGEAQAEAQGELPGEAQGELPGEAQGEAPAGAGADAGPVVDLLIAYSSAAKTRNGGQAGMDAEVALMVEQTNVAFATSGIEARVRLAHSVEVAANGPVDGATLGRLADRTDGAWDDLHVLRDAHGADLVALIVDSASGPYCGIAYVMNRVDVSFQTHGVSVTDAGCATGNLTFPHELGHNFGAAHDRGSWSGTPVEPYGYGWVNRTQGWRTMMAYTNACPGCRKLLRFSNGEQTHEGAPVGVLPGASNAADNRALLNLTASTVAGFRGDPVPASLTVSAPAGGAAVPASATLETTWSVSGWLGSYAKVELLRGGSVVKVLSAKVPLGTGRLTSVLPLSTPRSADHAVRVTPLLAPERAASSGTFSVVDPVLTPAHTLATTAPGGTGRVSWTYTGNPGGTVKVELLKDGKAIAVLAPGAALGTGGAGGVDVRLPAALVDGGGYRVRTTLTATRAAVPGEDFAISSTRRLVVTAPADGTAATAGSPLTVTWTAAGDVGTSVKAELLRGDVVAATSATTSATAGTLTLPLPARLPTGGYRVRLLSTTVPTVLAAAAGTVALDGTALALTSQAVPATVTAGRALPITWQTVGVPGSALKLEALAAGRAPVTIVASTPLAAGSYTWTVPVGLPEAGWTVRGTVVGNALVTATSAAAVAVAWPQVSAQGPAGGVAGAPVTVSWAFTDAAAPPVRIRLLQGTRVVATATTRAVTTPDGTGSFVYRLPITLAPGEYRFDVAAAANPALLATTGPAAVTRPSLAVTGGSAVARGSSTPVSWAFSDGAAVPVTIALVQGTRVLTVRSGAPTAADGTGTWVYKAPTSLAPGSYTLRIRPAALAGSTNVQASRAFTVS